MPRPAPRPQPDPATDGRIVTQALFRAADLMGLTQAEVAEIIGVSTSTASRLRNGQARLEAGSKPFQLAALLLRAWRSLDTIVSSSDAVAREWLRSPNAGLAEARPVDLLARPEGLARVCDYLDSRRGRL
jgi:putative toxin-antitoxin system antitoxin component (TIGR02293 family)